MTPALLYITSANREEAIMIARDLLAHRLIACANIVDHAVSLYHWQGEVEQKHEALLIGKTRREHEEQIVRRVKELHSYSAPCVVLADITGGSAEFLGWVAQETAPLPVE